MSAAANLSGPTTIGADYEYDRLGTLHPIRSERQQQTLGIGSWPASFADSSLVLLQRTALLNEPSPDERYRMARSELLDRNTGRRSRLLPPPGLIMNRFATGLRPAGDRSVIGSTAYERPAPANEKQGGATITDFAIRRLTFDETKGAIIEPYDADRHPSPTNYTGTMPDEFVTLAVETEVPFADWRTLGPMIDAPMIYAADVDYAPISRQIFVLANASPINRYKPPDRKKVILRIDEAAGGSIEAIVVAPRGVPVSDIAVSPDGRRMLFCSPLDGGEAAGDETDPKRLRERFLPERPIRIPRPQPTPRQL